MSGITLGDIRYNARNSSFEARVDVHAEGRTFRYPCAVRGGLNMDPTAIRSGLIADARQKSTGRTALRTVL